MKLKLDAYTGQSYVNLLRQVLMCRLEEARPIAFRVGTASNVIDIGDTVEEDMIEFISNVSTSTFVMNQQDGDFCLVKLESGDSPVCVQDLQPDVTVIQSGVKEILHPMSSVPIEIVFRKAIGKHTIEDNESFLEDHGLNVENYTVINSRHSPVSSVQVEEEESSDEDRKIFNISVITNGTESDTKCLEKALEIIREDVKSIYL